jgi:hypothetical protein
LTRCSDSLQVGFYRVDHFAVTSADSDVRTLSDEGFRDGFSQALASSGNKRDKILQFHAVHRLPHLPSLTVNCKQVT